MDKTTKMILQDCYDLNEYLLKTYDFESKVKEMIKKQMVDIYKTIIGGRL